MAPVHSPSARGVAAKRRGSDGEDLAQSSSQSSGLDGVARMAKQFKKGTKGRREKRRTEISNAYKVSVREIEGSTMVKFNEMMNNITDRHRRRLEGLRDLIRRRTAIEVRMLASIKNIENAFDFADKALSSALAHRIQDLAT